MEQISVVAPPLPPKTRRSPPNATKTTVLSSSNVQVFGEEYTYPNDVSREESRGHVVKICINPKDDDDKNSVVCAPCIISVNSPEMVNQTNTVVDTSSSTDRSSAYFFYNCAVMSSGQISPSDTLDSGTCSDLDGTPPPLPKKKNTSAGVSVTLIGGGHKRASSLTSSADSDDNESNISCDSLNSGKISPENQKIQDTSSSSGFLPQTLLQDIRERTSNNKPSQPDEVIVKSYEERREEEEIKSNENFDPDMFYKFHLNEHATDGEVKTTTTKSVAVEDESFAGYRDLLGDGASTIRSAKGTVRGVKNRVRAGIATFLQINSITKSYKEKDAGKVVVYTTTMGILRDTYQACMKVKQIMRTLLVKFEERDVFMSTEYQTEIRERMRCDHILVPQVFVDGQHIGDADTVERLNETGELRRILKPFKSMDACTTCKVCGGYRLLPCQVCKGSKKSVHRNHFTAEFVALKCMNCDEVGLVKCNSC